MGATASSILFICELLPRTKGVYSLVSLFTIKGNISQKWQRTVRIFFHWPVVCHMTILAAREARKVRSSIFTC